MPCRSSFRKSVVFSGPFVLLLLLSGVTPQIAFADAYADLKQQADAKYFTGRYDEAEAFYLQAKALNPDDPDLYRKLGDSLFRLARLDEAAECLETANAKSLTDVEGRCLLASVFMIQGKYTQAVDVLTEAIALQGDNAIALGMLVDLHMRMAQMDDAYKIAGRWAQADAQNRFVHAGLGALWLCDYRFPQAVKEYEKSLEVAPGYGYAYQYLGDIYMRQGKLDKAKEYLSKALERNPEDVSVIYGLGQLAFIREAYPEALDYFRKVIDRSPDYRPAVEYLKLAQNMVERKPGAGQQATADRPTIPKEVLAGYSETFQRLADKVRDDKKLACWFCSVLAYIYDSAGATEEASVFYLKAVEIDGNSERAKSALAAFEERTKYAAAIQGKWEDAEPVETGCCIIRTNIPEEDRKRLLDNVDSWLSSAERMLKDAVGVERGSPGAAKVRVNLFARHSEYKAYLDSMQMSVVADLMSTMHGGYAAVEKNEVVLLHFPGHLKGGLIHEFVHMVLGRSFQTAMPAWLNEGLAEYVVMKNMGPAFFMDYDRASPLVEAGGRSWYFSQLKYHDKESLSLEEVLSSTPSDSGRVHFNYASYWSLVTFLMEDLPDGPSKMRRFLSDFVADAVDLGSTHTVFETRFGRLDQILKGWRAFISAGMDDDAAWFVSLKNMPLSPDQLMPGQDGQSADLLIEKIEERVGPINEAQKEDIKRLLTGGAREEGSEKTP